MKRYLLLSLVVVVTIGLLHLPGHSMAQDDDPMAYFGDLVPEEGASLTVSGWGEESEQEVVRESIARFNELYPDVEVVYNPIPNDFPTAIKAAISGGTAPDVFYVNDDLLINLSPNGQLLTLNGYMELAGVSVDDYPSGLMSQWVDADGNVYGIPKDFNSLALFYVPALFDEADIDYPSADWTWDDMRAAAEAITEATDVTGMCTNPDAGRVPALINANGGSMMNEDFSAATFNSEEAVAAVDFWYGMYADGVGANPADIGMSWCGEAIGNALVGMAYEGGWLIQYLNTQFADVEWAVAPLPKSPDGGEGNLLFQNAWGAKADTAYPNAAALLVLFLTSPMNQAPIGESGFALPTHLDLLNDSEYLSGLDEASRVILAGAATGQPFFYGSHNGEVIGAFGSALNDMWLGEAEVAARLDVAAAEVDEIVSTE